MASLSLQSVSKSFPTARGPHAVLCDVDLTVAEGDFVAIVGHSGSGKTTLISLIAGLIPPDRGEIAFDGRPVTGPGPERGLVFQNYSLLPWMTVFENVFLAVAAVSPGLTHAAKGTRTAELLELVGLRAAASKHPHELSGGMRQRVAVARGLAMKPKMLLLDEPFSALDALTRATLQGELATILARERTTVVMITNDIEEAILLADRIYPLSPGPAATLGAAVGVPIPRPRSRRHLNLDPDYRTARRRLLECLLIPRRATAEPGAAQLMPERRAAALRQATA